MALDSDLGYQLLARADSGCPTGNDFDGRVGLRISAIFVILVGSALGAIFPVLAKHLSGSSVPSWVFFVAKFFGSGVIIATAFIHLLAPAEQALSDPCLDGPITQYSWVEGIILMTITFMFFIELMVMRYSQFGDGHGRSHLVSEIVTLEHDNSIIKDQIPGQDHLGHAHDRPDEEEVDRMEEYGAQLTAVFILEFGIIFHSIFIGLTLAVAGEEFTTLYIVIVFHQTFEGLGLGSRLAGIPWPKSRWMTPYVLGLAYALSTPIAISVGLAMRNTYPPGGRTTLIVNGVFDSISSGILIYTGLVELMAHEFMFSRSMRKAPIQKVLAAYGLLCLGAALMALVGKWV